MESCNGMLARRVTQHMIGPANEETRPSLQLLRDLTVNSHLGSEAFRLGCVEMKLPQVMYLFQHISCHALLQCLVLIKYIQPREDLGQTRTFVSNAVIGRGLLAIRFHAIFVLLLLIHSTCHLLHCALGLISK